MTWDERLIYGGLARPILEMIGMATFVIVTRIDYETGVMTLRGGMSGTMICIVVCAVLAAMWVLCGLAQTMAHRAIVLDYRAHRVRLDAKLDALQRDHEALRAAHEAIVRQAADLALIRDALVKHTTGIDEHTRATSVPNPQPQTAEYRHGSDDERRTTDEQPDGWLGRPAVT